MKIIKTSLLLTLLALTIVHVSSCSDDPDDNSAPKFDDPIAQYSFENDADDQVGNNDGDFDNITFSTKSPNNLAVQFNGNGYILINDQFDFSKRTISLWFNATVVTDQVHTIYSCDNPAVDYGMTLLWLQSVNGQPQLNFKVSTEQAVVDVETSRWYHAVITVDGKNYAYYLDGEKIDEGSFDSYLQSGNGITGSLVGVTRVIDRFYIGKVDDLRAYDRALSEKDVEALYEEEVEE
jgi:hypothetical protein